MTGHDDFDRTLAGWLEADARSLPPAGGLDRVIDATRRRSPRPGWLALPGSHWVGAAPMAGQRPAVRSLPRPGLRWPTALLLALVVAALVGGAILVGARVIQPSRLASPLGLLAYGLDGDIYVADGDGGNAVRIADGPPGVGPGVCDGYMGEGPMWSPDGRYLAYRSAWDDLCHGTVYVSDAEGRPVAAFPGTGWLVSWAPDSTRVATWVDLGKTIGIYGLDGVRQALITVSTGQRGIAPGDFDAVWSPDGTSLVLPASVSPDEPRQAWALPVDGSVPKLLPAADPRSHAAAYSPDGSHAAYVTDRQEVSPPPGEIPVGSLVVVAADGSQPRTLVPGGGFSGTGWWVESPVWAPAGDRIAFAVQSGAAQEVPTGVGSDTRSPSNELRVVDVASGIVTSLVGAGGTDLFTAFRFSSDGRRVLFSREDIRGVTSLWSVRADGTDAQLLVPGAGWADWQRVPDVAPTARPAETLTDGTPKTFIIARPYLMYGHTVTLTLPDGWTTDGRFIVKDRGLPGEIGLSAWSPGGIYPDPCHWQQTAAVPLEPSASGSSITDRIVTGLMAQRGRNASSAKPDIMRGPWSVWPIELSVPADLDLATCDQRTYKSWTDRTDPTGGASNYAPGQLDVVYIADLDRGPLLLDAWHFPGTSAASLAELQAALDSIELQ